MSWEKKRKDVMPKTGDGPHLYLTDVKEMQVRRGARSGSVVALIRLLVVLASDLVKDRDKDHGYTDQQNRNDEQKSNNRNHGFSLLLDLVL
jgi:hypothetical protein